MKTFYFDVETTGLDNKKAGLTQLAAIVVVNGIEVDSINLDINPATYCREVEISQDALNVTGKSLEELANYPHSAEQFGRFIDFLDSHINKFDKTDKFIPIGYNSQFDMGFMQEWFKDNGHQYFGSYFTYKDVDVFALVKILAHLGHVPVSLINGVHKLSNMAELFGVALGENAHDALADIRATRELYQVLIDKYVKS